MNFACFTRRTTPKVRNGKVQRKNRHQPTTSLGYVVDRESPRRGFRHVVTKGDVHRFVRLIPDWSELCVGIERILLTGGDPDESFDGCYRHFHREKTALVAINAWQGDLWTLWNLDYHQQHLDVLSAIGVAQTPEKKGVRCHFSLPQAKAFLLLHVFMHELGHHQDRMRWKQKSECRGGEIYAEEFANVRFATMLPQYVEAFGNPASSEQILA